MARFYVLMCGSGNYGGKEFDADLRRFPNPLYDPWIKADFKVYWAEFITRMDDVDSYWAWLWHLSVVCDGVTFVFPDNARYRGEMDALIKRKFPTYNGPPGAVNGVFDPVKKYAIAFNIPGAVLHETAHLAGWRHEGGFYG